MQHGSKMIKLDANRKGHHKKTFVLDPDMGGIRYEPSKKTSRCKLTSSCYLSDHLFRKDYFWKAAGKFVQCAPIE